MSKMIQLRNVPELHRMLKARAVTAGMSLSEYLIAEIRRSAQCPTLEELRQRVERRPSVELPIPAAALIRAERDAR